MRPFVRLLAAGLLAGQLAQWPVAAWCAEQHRQPASDCAQAPSSEHPMLGAAHGGSDGSCAIAGPCTLQAPAVTAASVTGPLVAAATWAPSPSGADAPRSFNPIPIPPPPQS